MKEYKKNPHYNNWWNKYQENRRTVTLILKCPYCDGYTSFSHSYEPVCAGSKILLECEECGKTFHAIAEVRTEKLNLTTA